MNPRADRPLPTSFQAWLDQAHAADREHRATIVRASRDAALIAAVAALVLAGLAVLIGAAR